MSTIEVRRLTDQQAERRLEILGLSKLLAHRRWRRRNRRPLVLRRLGWSR